MKIEELFPPNTIINDEEDFWNRLKSTIKFLDNVSDEDTELFCSPGDLLMYLCGAFGKSDITDIEDEIDTKR